MRAAVPTGFLVSLGCWFVFEIGLAVRDRVRRTADRGSDRGTRAIVALSLGAGIVLAAALPDRVPALDTPAPSGFAVAGLVVLWAGLATRAWAVLTLGRWFSTFVRADADQTVVTRGPYRWIRHPSYTGLLLITAGFGLGQHNWLSLAAALLLPALGLLPRIAIEESELLRVLGEQYRSYQSATKRLVPGLW